MKIRFMLRIISLILSLLMLSASFAACSDKENADNNGDATEGATDATGDKEDVDNNDATDDNDSGLTDSEDDDNVVDLDKLDDPQYRRPEYSDFIPLARAAAAEGMVLLKNEDEVLPLKKDDNVVLCGSGSINTESGPRGSGISSAKVYSLLEGMQIKQEEGKVVVNSEIADAYATDRHYKPDLATMKKARETSETAMVVISRNSRSGSDKNDQSGDYYLSNDEIIMIRNLVTAGFEDIIVVLNVGSVIDTTKLLSFPEVKAILLAWQPGEYCGLAMADVLVGDITPSGKLTDTLAKRYSDYPSSSNFDKSNEYVDYKEDIYVGYRYFETFDGNYDKVNFEFGFGLSYTTFEYSDVESEVGEDKITVSVKVTNTGEYRGREVAQVYFAAPYGELGKPGKELCAFGKTITLYPGEAQILTMEFDKSVLASYDDTGKVQKSAFVIEEGEYDFFVGGSIKQAVETGLGFTYIIEENIVVEQLSEQLKARLLKERLLADGSYEEVLSEHEIEQKIATSDRAVGSAPDELILFCDLYDNPELIDSFLAQMSDQSLLYLLYGHPRGNGKNDPSDIASFDAYAIPAIIAADGATGLSVSSTQTTSWPIATALGCTWNVELLERIGEEIGKEAKEKGVDVWRAPSANIHRNPLCGANYEYFSEDPLLTGVMVTALINGVQSKGVGACLQYLVANEKEYNRNSYDTRVSERALREIYLLPFRMAIENANPWMLMTSYNLVNGVETATNYSLITEIVRKEWGYDGVISSEWRNNTNILDEILAGQDLKMPSADLTAINEAIADGRVTRAMLEEHAERIIKLVLKTGKGKLEENRIVFKPDTATVMQSVDFSEKSSGIEVEDCKDEGVDKNICYTNAGKYLYYDIFARSDSNYTVTLRVASAHGEGAFDLYLDDTLIASFDNDLNTGDWQKWDDAGKSFVINLPTGNHRLKLVFTEDGLNFSKMTFTPTTDPVTPLPSPEETPEGEPDNNNEQMPPEPRAEG